MPGFPAHRHAVGASREAMGGRGVGSVGFVLDRDKSWGLSDSVALRVPYLKQRMIGSCGPACVEMVRGWLDPSAAIRTGSDMLPWARSWLFPFGMTESFGLAMLLADRGARVTVLKERPGFDLRPATGMGFDHVARAFGHAASPVARLREWEARRRGVRVSIEPVTVERLRQPDAARCPPIVMVNQGAYAPDPDWPGGVLHWVVVTDAGGDRVEFHDPDLGPGQRLSSEEFAKAMDLTSQGIDRQMLLTEPRSG